MKKTVFFVASAGGHLSEILRLEPLFEKYNSILITEKVDSSKNLKDKYNVRFLKYGSREYILKYIFVFLYNCIGSIYYILRYLPKTVVTTGAHTGGIVSFFAKILGAKIIYIESLAKVESLSVTGKNVYKFADKFYVQWEDLISKYEKAEYLGRLM